MMIEGNERTKVKHGLDDKSTDNTKTEFGFTTFQHDRVWLQSVIHEEQE